MSSFLDFTEEDLTVADKLTFLDKEIVKMQCIDHRENAQNGSLTLKCKVLSGPHEGKQTNIYLNSNDNEASKKVKAQFLKAFWSLEDLKAKNIKLAKLIGRLFTVKSLVKVKEGTGTVFQNWAEFTDVGAGDGTSPPVAAAAGQSTAAASPQPTVVGGTPSF
jgi:hypothetical protein